MTTPYAPQWLIPDQAGELCNFHGSNTGADAITTKARYLNPSQAGDRAGMIRVQVNRTVLKGVTQAAQLAWDTGWVGGPFLPAAPLALSVINGSQDLFPNRAVNYGSRAYLIGTDGTLISSSINGPSLGSWRTETGPTLGGSDTGFTAIAATTINGVGYLYVVANATVYYTSLNGDGTIGGWKTFSVTPVSGIWNMVIGTNSAPSLPSGQQIFIMRNFGSGGQTLYLAALGTDGSLSGTAFGSNQGTTDTVIRTQFGLFYDSYNKRIVQIGGDDGTNALATVRWIDGTNIIGAWNNGLSMPAGRNLFGLAAVGTGNQMVVYVIGGALTKTTPVAQTSVYGVSVDTTRASHLYGGTAWTTETTVTAQMRSFAWNGNGQDTAGGGSLGYPLFSINGGATAPTEATATGTPPLTSGTWSTGGTALASGQLGTGGSVTNDPAGTPQGSQDIIFNYNAFGATATITSFNDADQVQYTVYFTDSSAGDVSPSSTTTIAFGQPPAITSVSPANAAAPTTGLPAFSFTATPGAGGKPEKTWQTQIKQASTVMYDTGLKYDQTNSGQVSGVAALLNAITYTMVITVTAQDTAMSGSTVTTTSTTTFTPSLTAQAAPTSLTVVPDNVNGLVTLTWVNGVSSSYTRAYFRLNGTTAWTLLKDNAAGTTVQLMDQIALSTAYDYKVTNVSAGGVESADSNIVSNVTIAPDYHFETAGYHAELHVVGNGPAQHVGLFLTDNPVIAVQRDTYWEMMFGQTAPSARFGTSQFRKIELHVSATLTNQAAFDAIMTAANAGSKLCYRDLTGLVIYCTLDHENTHQRKLHQYADFDTYLVEIAFTFTP